MNPLAFLVLTVLLAVPGFGAPHRYLYVATPGIRDYLEYGGHGLLVFDMDAGHRFLRRIPTGGLNTDGRPLNVKGICASVPLQRVFISTPKTMMAIDLGSEKLLWEKPYPGGCDRMSISPDGKTIYMPSFESDHWNVVDAASGEVVHKVMTRSGSHNTVFGPDGTEVYLAGLRSPDLFVADALTGDIKRKVGPFSAAIRPFTVNGRQTLCFVNVNELLGFQIGDLHTGKVVETVKVAGFKTGPVKRHGCPSHGIGLTPDESELWLADSFNHCIHIFDNTQMPPKQAGEIALHDQPGWITFSIDGHYAYPSSGEIIDTASRKIIGTLKNERGGEVQSEKMLEIDFEGAKPVRAGDQFGVGQKRS
jgi:DNA-binding beta-propeller fold protein YncE